MRIRYAFKLDLGDDKVAFVTLNNKKSEEEVKEMFSDKGCIGATFHERVRTGYRINETGDLVPTGLVHTENAPTEAPAKAEAPKAKKGKKSKKSE